MDINSNDLAVIEQALQEAMNNGHDYKKIMYYREVLSKLQGIPTTGTLQIHMQHGQVLEQAESQMDGIRYDYDDDQGIHQDI